ncbi:MAG: tRNA (adenine-N1)-methyltransferase [Candidatus Methanofastidiosa archaeon]|nr:tRNA (adenine-N1)-methyltransferase [Candidatus Methanofastidiosa archaeon]MDD4281481.1 tRNA (adenine-N1)-methyltransferase [Candidatus Methanofastidiosa archaeon]
MPFQEGDRVLLLDRKGKKFMLTIGERDEFHTHNGIVHLSEIVGKEPGCRLITHMQKEFTVLRPTLVDYVQKMKKLPQTIQFKDACQILAHTGLASGHSVVEAGVGSGALTLFLSQVIAPGIITSYEIREDFANLSRKNLEAYGVTNSVIKLQDIYDGIDETDVDLVALDLPEPERVVAHAHGALRAGGHLFSFSPTIEQVIRFHAALEDDQWMEVRTIECITREYEVKRNGTRPKTLMLGHTGYLSFARRI